MRSKTPGTYLRVPLLPYRSPLEQSTAAFHTGSLSLPLVMSSPPNNEKPQRKWFKEKFRSVFSSKSPSRNLDVSDARLTSTNVPPINDSFLAAQARENSASDGPRVIADHTGSGE